MPRSITYIPQRTLPASQPPATTEDEISLNNPARRIALILGVILVFLRVSMLHQIQTVLVGVNLRLLYLFGLPAIAGVLFAGGIRRAFRGRPAFYWAGFAVCLILASPFSYWRGGSANLLLSYFRVDFIMLFVIGGLAVSWRDCKMVMGAIAAGAVVNLLSSRLFAEDYLSSGRFGMGFGSVSNPNDFAAHLLMSLPFLLWVALQRRFFVVRMLALAGVGYGIYIILRTGSRGALVGLCVAALFVLIRGTVRQRIVLLVSVPVTIAILVALLPQIILQRITAFSADNPAMTEATRGSTAMREYLIRKSLTYTLQNPLFGVGPGQFGTYEGMNNVLGSTAHGYWHDTHNTFTQVSSECGLPAVFFYIGGILSSFLALNRAYRRSRRLPDCDEIRNATFCIMLSLTVFCTAIFFLSFAYFFYLPALAGLSIAVSKAAEAEFFSKQPAGPALAVPVSRGRQVRAASA